MQSCLSKEVISSAATVRVINVIRHWVSKFSRDFEATEDLREAVTDFLEEIASNPNLLPTEQRGASAILRYVSICFSQFKQKSKKKKKARLLFQTL